ncbi:DUF2177 family protein [Glaciecola sp. XM2]|jgi:uncharacterized membrane protein|uniref:DUF2177 family protein n=1 Tax=Glaciecola sp. XM2 TaxID=1914931 RepID=UPI001BDEB171|nr:DUF2177 family protein [Glaciecola sp. XM2]MBT1451562.1 DUF2177 family protein [Glaciecola sp. XM2]
MLANVRLFFKNISLSLMSILLAFAILDFVWLGLISPSWYQAEMAGMLRENFITWPWLVFYLMYGCVTFVLAVVPNRDKPAYYAMIDGALLGLAAYGAYNLTNYSILEGFTLKIMLIDWVWGTCLTALCATAGWFGFQFLRK